MTPERKAALLATVATPLMRLWLATLRFRLIDHAGVLDLPPRGPLLWAFWHNRLFVMPRLFEKYLSHRQGAGLASASKDGEILAAFLRRFGIRPIRGSSSRRGLAALVEMKRAIDGGTIVALAPDGPRGPRYQLNPGLIKLAQVTGQAILPIHVAYSSFWQLKNWDRFMIPKPFAVVDITFGTPFDVSATSSDADFEKLRNDFEQILQNNQQD